MTRRNGLAALLLIASAAPGAHAGAQEPTAATAAAEVQAVAGVAPDTVTVGDPFVVRLGVTAPPGARVHFPPFSLMEPVEAADSLRVTRDSTQGWVATYSLRGWLPADSLVVRLAFRLIRPDGTLQDHAVRVRLPVVASVLPADSALHEPRPAKAILPLSIPSNAGGGWLLPALLLAALVLAAIALVTRRRRPHLAVSVDPRDRALADLAAIEAEQLAETGEADAYYVRTSRVLRRYLAAVAALGEDLTSSELLRLAAAERLSPDAVEDLRRLLRSADRVKFGGEDGGADAQAARTYGGALRHWIQRWPAVAPADEREAAA